MQADYSVILSQRFRSHPAGSRLYVAEGKAPVVGCLFWLGTNRGGWVAILGAEDRRYRYVRFGRDWRWRRVPKRYPAHAVVGIEFPYPEALRR